MPMTINQLKRVIIKLNCVLCGLSHHSSGQVDDHANFDLVITFSVFWARWSADAFTVRPHLNGPPAHDVRFNDLNGLR
ncbi:hypothetical protein O181_123971 [Austropuccinia psidii MF-1]|uniref:Uncharacterized protein n=1 Tax=Austropuccinia psidii MF-1 TaxID=1389203 RepID=A0A9Q3Q3R0_9BASI|nr:hypothetical protein [Austropuccinia psidii MF-1]